MKPVSPFRRSNREPGPTYTAHEFARPPLGARAKVAYIGESPAPARHLKESQPTMVLAQLADMKPGTRTDLASIDARSQPENARLLNVSRASVQRPAR